MRCCDIAALFLQILGKCRCGEGSAVIKGIAANGGNLRKGDSCQTGAGAEGVISNFGDAIRGQKKACSYSFGFFACRGRTLYYIRCNHGLYLFYGTKKLAFVLDWYDHKPQSL